MTVEKRVNKGGKTSTVCLACPMCNEELGDGQSLACICGMSARKTNE